MLAVGCAGAISKRMSGETILLTGATGFVGSALYPVLARRGAVRCLTRDAARARGRWPHIQWVEGDVTGASAGARALEGCGAAFYLVHSIGEGRGFRGREVEAARRFAEAAGRAGVRRIAYLGGVAPSGRASEHLKSRLEVGEALRAGPVLTVELRASMIIGYGSVSWLIVRDLAARLPVMVLPRWLRSCTEPVAIDDVTVALDRALDVPLDRSAWFDIPGPEVLSGEQILLETARAMGLPPPRRVAVPVLTPQLSSLWIRFVTRAPWSVAHELVLGLGSDLMSHDDRFWRMIGHERRLPFHEAARRALEAERREAPPGTGAWAAVERALASRMRKVPV
jgi:uncharacterized protein YbjT (DUF2867 family)